MFQFPNLKSSQLHSVSFRNGDKESERTFQPTSKTGFLVGDLSPAAAALCKTVDCRAVLSIAETDRSAEATRSAQPVGAGADIRRQLRASRLPSCLRFSYTPARSALSVVTLFRAQRCH